MNIINTLMPNFERLAEEFYECLYQTVIMVLVSGTIAWVLGVALGVTLVVTRSGGIMRNRLVFNTLDRCIALVFGTVPFFSRQIEQVLSEIDGGLVEAAQSMGLSPWEIIFSVYLKESIPGITRVTMITFVSFIGITAIAGAIGAGGLGDFAIRYGYQMGYRDMIWLTVIVILLMISIFQFIGNFIIKKTTH